MKHLLVKNLGLMFLGVISLQKKMLMRGLWTKCYDYCCEKRQSFV